MCDTSFEIEEFMAKRQPGLRTFDEYYPENDSQFEEIYQEPDSFVGTKAILEFSTFVRKYADYDEQLTSKQILRENVDDQEITELLKEINLYGEKGNKKDKSKKRVRRKNKESSLDESILLDESFFKLKERNRNERDSNSDETRKEYTPREVYLLKRRK